MVTSGGVATFVIGMPSPADRAAFERLVADHHARACAVAYAVLRDRARSEDIAQDALLLAWERRDHVPPHAAAWLCAIARNLARNAARRPRALPLDGEVADTDAGDPLHSMLEAEELRLAGEALASLPDDEREAIVLFYRCGASVHAIAGALDITEVAARKRLQRGRDHLRARVDAVERRLARSRPGAAIAGACVAAWLVRCDGATAAAATATTSAPATAAVGKAKLVALAVGAASVAGGAWMLARAVEPPAEAATIAPAPAAPAPPRAAYHADPAPALADAGPPAPAAPPPLDPRYAAVPFHTPLLFPPDGGKLEGRVALQLVADSARMPIYVDGVDLSVELDLGDLHGDTVGEVFDQLLSKLDATRTEVPGVQTATFGDAPASCAAPFGGDRVDATFDDAPELGAASDLISEHLRVPMYVAQKAWPITVKLHGTAGEAFDQLLAASHMPCTIAPGYVLTPRR